MLVYAFIGKAGTGKSYNALSVASKYGIRYIIDDAILIKDNKIICGKSAKTEDTVIASVKIAVFMNEDRKKEMKKALKSENVDKLLLLGTSDKMVDQIADNLGVGKILERIYIEDVASKEHIDIATKSRYEDGKHVVPVPTFEVKEQFSGYFLDPLRIFSGFKKEEQQSEKTIIRPTYSYLGDYKISEKVINLLIEHTLENYLEIPKIYKILSNKYSGGIKISIDISVRFGSNLPNLSNKLRNDIIKEIDKATGINIYSIDINIKNISMEKNK